MELDRNGLEVLERPECLRLLSQCTLGRIAFTSCALPCVLPINFHLRDEQILIRTRRGGRLDDALRGAVVAFEVDDVDQVAHAGWSIAVTGVAAEVTDPVEAERAKDEPVERWPQPGPDSLVSISTEMLTGRRLTARSGPTRR
jgi:nitroimidazol reductase NimA-like FMN-containing flavoprotein (pyridoxamine 5'-phosphate oxidase superfamily)